MNQKDFWNLKWSTIDCKLPPTLYAKRVNSFLKNKKCKTLLDLGCGDGKDSFYFAKNNFKVTAIDFSKSAIAIMNKEIEAKMIKNVNTAIKNIKNIKFDVILIGSGENPDKIKIRQFIEKHRLENVHLIEFIPNAVNYFKAFDIFILPSIKEGLPYTIIEAMVAELPIIATNVGGIPEMTENNINGILIEPKNPDIIGEKILYIINNPKEAKQMAQKAKQKAEQEFCLKKMLEKTKNIY